MKAILETSFLIELERKNEKAIEILQRIKENFEDIIIPAISLYELYYGAYKVSIKIGSDKSLRFLDFISSLFPVKEIDKDICEKAGMLKVRLEILGEKVPDADILIAACSDENSVIFTFDNHFKKFEKFGVKVKIL